MKYFLCGIALVALAACSAPATPYQVGALDAGDSNIIPMLNEISPIVVELHLLPQSDFQTFIESHGHPMAGGISFAADATHDKCIIYMRKGDARPDNWRNFGATINHELAHCEGWPADHPANWHIPQS